MSYSARIPEYLIFNGSMRPKKVSTNASWDRLPTTHPEQKDARRFKEKAYEWNYWVPSTAKEVEKYREQKNTYIHKNEPTKLKLVGWAYEDMQVVLPSGHLVDLPLDILYNTVRSGGFEKDNKTFKGKFVFAMANRKLIPVKVGSGIHKGILDHIKLKERPKIKVKDLVVGNVYSTPAGNSALFLGYVNTETMVVDIPKGTNRWGRHRYNKFDTNKPVEKFNVRFLKKKLASLWFETNLATWDGRKYKPEEILNSVQSAIKSRSVAYRFRCKKSHRYVTKVPNLYVDLPTNIVQQVRNAYEQTAREVIDDSRTRRGSGISIYNRNIPKNAKRDKLRHYDALRVRDYAAECNMTLYGMDFIRSDVFKQFEPWEVKKKKKSRKRKKKKSD